MPRFIRRLATAAVCSVALYQIGPFVAPTSASANDQRVLVNAPDPPAASAPHKSAPQGAVVRQLPKALGLPANPNHVRQLSAAETAGLGARGLRSAVSQTGSLTGVVDTGKGAFRLTFTDGYLPSGRQVIGIGIEPASAASHGNTAASGGFVIDAAAATKFMGACSYSTVDPSTNNLFLYVCARDAVLMAGVLVVLATAAGAVIGSLLGPPGTAVGAIVGALIGAVFAVAILVGVWRIENNDFSISLTLPPGVWQNLSGWFYYGSGQYVYVNGNPCSVYYENVGWVQGCQLSDTFSWVAVNWDGRLEPFVIGGGNSVYSNAQQCNPNCAWTGWMNHGGNMVQRPTLASDVNGELNIMGVGSGGNLRENFQASPGSPYWYLWYTLGCCFTGNVAMGRNADGRLEAVVRNANGNIDHYWETGVNGAWNGYAHLMCCFASSPTIESNTDGRLEVFAIDNYQHLYHAFQTAPNGGWSGHYDLGCCLIGNPQAGRLADGSLIVFGIGTDHNLYYKRQTSAGGGWSANWTGLGGGGNLTSQPAVRLNVDGRMEVFVIDSNNHLRDVWENSPNGSWSWGDLGCCVKGDPDVQINMNGVLEAFAIGMDNGLWHKWQSGPAQGPWSAWQSLGGTVVVTP